MSVKILLLGKNGQLGWELCRTLACLGKVVALDYPEVDFTQPDRLSALVRSEKPAVVVNAAAYTAVDRAESEAGLVQMINATAPAELASAAREVGAGFIHYSTDYVFDGQKGARYTEQDQPHPLSVYGATKLDGENWVQETGAAAWIFRTSWVFSTRRDSFVSKVLQWSREQKVLKVVDDQVSDPTWARALAEATSLALVKGGTDLLGWMSQTRGLYHLAGDGCASRLEWAQEILKYDPHPEGRLTEVIEPAKTADFPTPATRPLFSALDCKLFYTTFGFKLPRWQDALKLAMETVAA
jgi:dTDP-4-dehydrorhamnose reductase